MRPPARTTHTYTELDVSPRPSDGFPLRDLFRQTGVEPMVAACGAGVPYVSVLGVMEDGRADPPAAHALALRTWYRAQEDADVRR